ncbi:MAG: transposase [Xanthomonadales bacterium]|nr:transposase [Xanthomonadales bacterium]
MPNYRRPKVPGATWFLTMALADRTSDLLVRRIDLLRVAFQGMRRRHPFEVVAMVVLPDHLHAVWSLPQGDSDYSLRVGQMKGAFSHAVGEQGWCRASHGQRRERGIWQRRFWEHLIRDERDLRAHIDYVHRNPVKHGLVAQCADWPHSTFARQVARGDFGPDHGGEGP